MEFQSVFIKKGMFLLENISFSIPAGAYAILMGNSGSGKTTILEALCGLNHIESGKITVDGKEIQKLMPGHRGIGLVPQDAALFNNMTIMDNIGYALKIRGMDKALIKKQVVDISRTLDMEFMLDRFPDSLSGGERQRVAIARAIIFKPLILCLDEPLSALDDDSKIKIGQLIKDIQEKTKITVLQITHSREEAKRLGNHILFLENGQVKII